eukprot:11161808-Lingulodinium_polyedra.AAC.1
MGASRRPPGSSEGWALESWSRGAIGSPPDSDSASEERPEPSGPSLLRASPLAELAAGTSLSGRRGLRCRSGR